MESWAYVIPRGNSNNTAIVVVRIGFKKKRFYCNANIFLFLKDKSAGKIILRMIIYSVIILSPDIL